MNIEKRIAAFAELGNFILEYPISLQEITHKTFLYNTWFTEENTKKSLQNIASSFLTKEKLEHWVAPYQFAANSKSAVIALVAAGNIPLVAFHDLLCVLISGHCLQLKVSEKDKFLYPFLLNKLVEIEPLFKERIALKERLENFDAIIATGSNNTSKHFEFYFGKYKNIIRKNRNSVAILNGTETLEELNNLGHDVFDYFGLGCRNVSKVFVPTDFDVLQFKEGFAQHIGVAQHNQYMNNLDYQRTLYLMNQTPLLDIDFINITENKSLFSPISCLHFERYSSLDAVKNNLITEAKNIQCVVSSITLENSIPLGKSQQPTLTDYADNIDTMAFLKSI